MIQRNMFLRKLPLLNKELKNRIIKKWSSAIHTESYDNAITQLNLLMPDYVVNRKLVENKNLKDFNRHISETRHLLDSIGIHENELRKLKVIHVSGSRGKGSTCVLVEQLLKSIGLRTGFYSSPHIFKVNERIRINGVSISDEMFAKYFWKIYKPIMKKYGKTAEPPEYFKYLTAMAFNIFLEENVDVAVVESGIGGTYDPTNILPHTKTVGITTCHKSPFAKTYEAAALNMAGIIKDRSDVYTFDQNIEILATIANVARQHKAKLRIVPKFDHYKWMKRPKLTINHNIQKLNASLAIQLAYNWILNYKQTIPPRILDKVCFLLTTPRERCPTDVPDEFIDPLQSCYWPGRCHVLHLKNKTIYFDSAHTEESMKVCVDWFQDSIRNNKNLKCLLFNGVGDRDYNQLLKVLHDNVKWDLVYFTPNCPYARDIINDCSRHEAGGYKGKVNKCFDLKTIWVGLQVKSSNQAKVIAMPCISQIFDVLNATYKNQQLDILVTGSAHLVGETLKYLYEDKF